jgi:hypothetical protein
MIMIYRVRADGEIEIVDDQVPDIAAMCQVLDRYRNIVLKWDTAAQPFVTVHLDSARPVMVIPGGEAFYARTIKP